MKMQSAILIGKQWVHLYPYREMENEKGDLTGEHDVMICLQNILPTSRFNRSKIITPKVILTMP